MCRVCFRLACDSGASLEGVVMAAAPVVHSVDLGGIVLGEAAVASKTVC